jgi:hypothetical protein
MVGIKEVVEKEDVVIVTSGGIVIRQHASEIRVAGRNTQGVRLIKLDVDDTISDVAVVVPEEDEPTNGEGVKPDAGQENAKPGDSQPGSANQPTLFDEKRKPVQKKKTEPPPKKPKKKTR